MGKVGRFFLWLATVAVLVQIYLFFSASRYTVAVPCRIVTSAVKLEADGLKWSADYHYTVDGKEYTSQDCAQGREAELEHDRFPVGLAVCYVDPNNPYFSRLEPERYLTGALFFFLVTLMLLSVWSWRRFGPGKEAASYHSVQTALGVLYVLGIVGVFDPLGSCHRLLIRRAPVPARVLRVDHSLTVKRKNEARIFLEYTAGGRTRTGMVELYCTSALLLQERCQALRDQPQVEAWLAVDDPNDIRVDNHPLLGLLEGFILLAPLWPFVAFLGLGIPGRPGAALTLSLLAASIPSSIIASKRMLLDHDLMGGALVLLLVVVSCVAWVVALQRWREDGQLSRPRL